MARFSFKSKFEYDLALVTQVEFINPFSVQKTKAKSIWEEVAENLRKNQSIQATDRNCRERIDQLINEFRANERLSIKSSGLEEKELTDFQRSVENIAKLEELQQSLPKGFKKLYSKASRVAAEKIRTEALLTVEVDEDDDEEKKKLSPKSVGTELPSTSVSHSEKPAPSIAGQSAASNEPKDATVVKPAKKPRGMNTAKSDLIAYLETKNGNESKLKKEELKVRSSEAENRRLELQLQQEKQASELDEKRKLNEMLFKILDKHI